MPSMRVRSTPVMRCSSRAGIGVWRILGWFGLLPVLSLRRLRRLRRGYPPNWPGASVIAGRTRRFAAGRHRTSPIAAATQTAVPDAKCPPDSWQSALGWPDFADHDIQPAFADRVLPLRRPYDRL